MRILMVLLAIVSPDAGANEISTNTIVMPDAPSWLTTSRVERIVEKIEGKLEWDLRKVRAYWIRDAAAFKKAHGFDSSVLAFSNKSDLTIHLGPQVIDKNFDGVFGHELVHIILAQKYKNAIPSWLEEGLANYLAKTDRVDYKWLSKQKLPDDFRALVHPFKSSPVAPGVHYIASTALLEMIASKCNIYDLLQLSVGRRLETYLNTTCGITDVNAEFRKWIEKKARSIVSDRPR